MNGQKMVYSELYSENALYAGKRKTKRGDMQVDKLRLRTGPS